MNSRGSKSGSEKEIRGRGRCARGRGEITAPPGEISGKVVGEEDNFVSESVITGDHVTTRGGIHEEDWSTEQKTKKMDSGWLQTIYRCTRTRELYETVRFTVEATYYSSKMYQTENEVCFRCGVWFKDWATLTQHRKSAHGLGTRRKRTVDTR